MKVGFINWCSMVGPVLMQRIEEEDDFAHIPEVFFFIASNVDGAVPDFGRATKTLLDTNDVTELAKMDIIATRQGGDYTKFVFQPLRNSGWDGYWIDATSSLCMKDGAIIVLDPVNRNIIDSDLEDDVKNYIGGSCIASLMLMALGGLFQNDLIEWATSMAHQAASDAGAENIRELIDGMGAIRTQITDELTDPSSAILDIDRKVSDFLRSESYPRTSFGVPLAGSLVPWIDMDLGNGQPGEEWKSGVETNKIPGHNDNPAVIDGLCVRIDSMRYHSQAITLKLKKDLPVSEIEAILADANDWVKVIPNEEEASIHELTSAKATDTLSVLIGRIRKLGMSDEYISALTIGDQLLWGAAEPLYRVLCIILGSL